MLCPGLPKRLPLQYNSKLFLLSHACKRTHSIIACDIPASSWSSAGISERETPQQSAVKQYRKAKKLKKRRERILWNVTALNISDICEHHPENDCYITDFPSSTCTFLFLSLSLSLVYLGLQRINFQLHQSKEVPVRPLKGLEWRQSRLFVTETFHISSVGGRSRPCNAWGGSGSGSGMWMFHQCPLFNSPVLNSVNSFLDIAMRTSKRGIEFTGDGKLDWKSKKAATS